MIDRLVHHAEVLTLTGDSYRTRARRELLDQAEPQQPGLTDHPRGQNSENPEGSIFRIR